MSEQANLRLIDPVRDAAALAEMWNESDGEWPGTWNSGVPTTARDIRDWHEKEEYTAVFVWMRGRKSAGTVPWYTTRTTARPSTSRC